MNNEIMPGPAGRAQQRPQSKAIITNDRPNVSLFTNKKPKSWFYCSENRRIFAEAVYIMAANENPPAPVFFNTIDGQPVYVLRSRGEITEVYFIP